MQESTETIRDKILAQALPSVVFDGWTLAMLRQAATTAGYSPDMADAVFTDGVTSALEHFSAMMDRAMLAKIQTLNAAEMRVRDRIRAGVLARLAALEPYREAEKLAVSYWARPGRVKRGGKVVWRTADAIWTWAGDTATDYNRYTKRGLLSGVLAATTLVWLRGGAPAAVEGFLDRRLDNVLQWGRFMGGIKTKFGRAETSVK